MSAASITDVANALNYLLAARAMTVVDGQAQVWWDYLTHEISHLQQAELLPACRRVIRDWGQERRSWQVDVERYAAAIRALRRERVDAATGGHGIPNPPGLAGDARLELAWKTMWAQAVQTGATPAEAEQAAWAEIGREPPPQALPSAGPSGAEAARAVIKQLTKNRSI